MAVVADKLTATDAEALLELIEEDQQPFVEALEFAALSDGVCG